MRFLKPLLAALLACCLPAVATAQTAGIAVSQANAPQANNARDALLITATEQSYAAGLAAYQAGKADEARTDFDRAVDSLLSSGVDIKSSAALSAELDRVVDRINTLQLDALQGSATANSKEDSPVDVANDVTFAVDPKVEAQAIAELRTTQSDLPLVINDYVAGYINFFSTNGRGRGTIVASLQRAGKYKTMIQKVLKEEGVPQDLLYQAVAESGFKPQAVNPKSGAAGMWQFMPFSGYGLEKSGWYDERFDPEKATRAYARNIKKMYAQLGDWYLAMAAYDWGPGNIQKAVQRTGYVDFWELYRRNNLPQETKNYVPIILAVAIMAKNPQQYGLDKIVPNAAVLPDTVTTSDSVSLPLVADVTDAPLTTIEELNPSLLRGRTPPGEPYDLHVPAGTAMLYSKRIAQVPQDKRVTWRFHVPHPGETLDEVARMFHTTASEIAFTNRLDAGSSLTAGTGLVVPVVPAVATPALASGKYRVRHGDTLVTIADQFSVPVASLERWNRLRGRAVGAGSLLYIVEPALAARGGRAVRGKAAAAAGRRAVAVSPRKGARKGVSRAATAALKRTVHRS